MRLLWVKTELLHPVDKGGKIRTYQMLKALKREHHVTYLTLDDGASNDEARAQGTEYCHELICVPHSTRAKFTVGFYLELARNLASPLPYFMRKYVAPAMRREIEARMSDCDVLVCDFLQPSVNMPASIPTPTVLFQHNVEAMIWRRHYEVQTNPLKKAYLYGQWRKAFAYERAACRRFDQVIAVSREDAETMRREYGVTSVADVPTGVDTEFFQPRGETNVKPHSLVFTGSMDWLPNEDAMQFFIREIMPRIRESIPDVTLTIVGRDPFPSLIEQSRRDPAITVTGRVEDVRPYIEQAAAYIVPIRIGGGTRLKIYEAMAMARPVVSTTIGAEGLPVRAGEEVLIADEPEEFAAACVRVLNDDVLARTLGAQAAAVRQKYGWARVAAQFSELCARAVQSHRTKDAALARAAKEHARLIESGNS